MTTTALRQRRRSRFPIIRLLSVLCMIAGVSLFLLELISFSQRQESLPADVTVGGIRVGNLNSVEALSRVQAAYRAPIVLYYEDSPILLDPGAVGFRIQGEAMVTSATSAGDSDGRFWTRFAAHLLGQDAPQTVDVPLQADYQRNLVDQFLRDISLRYDRPSGLASYDLQTLTLRPGSEGSTLDIPTSSALIDAALRSPTDRVLKLPLITTSPNEGNIDTLRRMIEDYLNTEGFVYDGQTTVASVYVLDLKTGQEVNINGDVAFSAASTMKVPILVDYFRQLWNAVPQLEAWLMANSLLCSNNSSSNLLMQIIGERVSGQQDIFAGIADVTENVQYLGARNTYITAPFDLGVAGQQLGSIPAPRTTPNPAFNTNPDPYNQTTAEDLGTLFSLIYDCANYGSGLMAAYPDGEYTQTECQQMLELMSANDLQRLLQGGIPKGIRISHKNGWVADTSADAGIVFSPNGRDYVLSVFLWEKSEFQDYEKLWPLVEGISRATWNYFNPENPLVSPRTDLPATAQECVGNFLPPGPEQVDLNNINGWRTTPAAP